MWMAYFSHPIFCWCGCGCVQPLSFPFFWFNPSPLLFEACSPLQTSEVNEYLKIGAGWGWWGWLGLGSQPLALHQTSTCPFKPLRRAHCTCSMAPRVKIQGLIAWAEPICAWFPHIHVVSTGSNEYAKGGGETNRNSVTLEHVARRVIRLLTALSGFRQS